MDFKNMDKNKKFTKENVLCINSICKNDNLLKNFLFSEDLKEDKCEMCGQLPLWNSKKLDLVIFRKIKKNNNMLDNLKILCPNCHSQKQIKKKDNREAKKCITCGRNFFSITKKISLDPSSDLIYPGKKIIYQQTRCKFCLGQSVVDKKQCHTEIKIV